MKVPAWIWIALAVAAGTVGCKRENPLYCCTIAEACDGLGMATCDDPAQPFCDNFGEFGPGRTCVAPPGQSCDGNEDCTGTLGLCVDGLCSECETSADCPAERPVCDQGGRTCGSCQGAEDCTGFAEASICDQESGACVGCLGADDCTEASAPICDDDDRMCRGCVQGSECASGLCDSAGGACVAQGDILYVDADGTGTDCTQAAPCPTIQQAIDLAAGNRIWIAVAPATYTEHLTIEDTTVRIVGPGATVAASELATPVIIITNAANVDLRDLIVGPSGGSGAHGVHCPTASTVSLRNLTITGNGGDGVRTNECTLTIDATTIHGNSGGGLTVNGGVFTVRNSMLAKNGGVNSLVGGANLAGAAGSSFEHNTVTGNGADTGIVAGVQCTVSGGAELQNNIIYSNGEGAQVSGNCTHAYSLIGPESVAGQGNLSDAPSFANAAGNDFHLTAGSAGIDAANPSAIATDIDGDLRPHGDGPDMGADEVTR